MREIMIVNGNRYLLSGASSRPYIQQVSVSQARDIAFAPTPVPRGTVTYLGWCIGIARAIIQAECITCPTQKEMVCYMTARLAVGADSSLNIHDITKLIFEHL